MGLDACQTLGLVTRIDSVSASVNQLENDSVTKHYLSVMFIRMKEGVVPYSVSAPRRVKIPLLPKLKVYRTGEDAKIGYHQGSDRTN